MSDVILGEVELPESPIPDGCFRVFREATVKRDGCVWRIHKNDADPFPSNPHAHNLDSGLTLDLRTGELYLRTNPTGKSVSKKHLNAILAEAGHKGITIPAAWEAEAEPLS